MQDQNPYDSQKPRYDSSSQQHNDKNFNSHQPEPQMSMEQAVRACFDKYADFEGRSRRSEYWYFRLFQLIMILGLYLLGGIGYLIHESLLFVFMGLVVLFVIATFIPGLAVTVRRFHDAGQSGWLILLDIFCTGGIVSIIFGCIDSQAGRNQYGPNPKGIANDW